MEGETEYLTKRFRVYCRIMATRFTEDVFEHYQILQKSAYIMIRKSELEIHPQLLQLFTKNSFNFMIISINLFLFCFKNEPMEEMKRKKFCERLL